MESSGGVDLFCLLGEGSVPAGLLGVAALAVVGLLAFGTSRWHKLSSSERECVRIIMRYKARKAHKSLKRRLWGYRDAVLSSLFPSSAT